MIRYLATLWSRPMAFHSDPTGHVLNQIGHIAVGAALALVLPLWVVTLVVIAWEGSQLMFRGADPADAIEDAAFMCGGAIPALWPALALLLAMGLRERA